MMIKRSCRKKRFTYASNVPETKPYWVATCHEFKSTSLSHSYINKMHPTMFHMGSISANADGQLVLNNNSHFTSAVQKYKHVVTHFLASKITIWYNIVMQNIHNVVDAMITKQFASLKEQYIITL